MWPHKHLLGPYSLCKAAENRKRRADFGGQDDTGWGRVRTSRLAAPTPASDTQALRSS